jgi:thiosulfate dehydrogenase [quinone] large subunit
MGSTCLDEWTMAVSGVAMSSAVFMAGGGTWSLDALLGRSAFAGRSWTRWIFSGALSPQSLRALGLLFAAVAVVFTVGSYQMLFGAVVSPLNARVNFHRHAIDLSGVTVAGGAVRFDAYVDAGPDTGAAYVIAARLVDGAGAVVASWDGAALRGAAIENAWPYAWAAQFSTETIGFSGATGAHAVITLPIPADASLGDSPLSLVLEAIDGATWQQAAQREG